MSNPIEPVSESLNIQTIQAIDQLDLPIMKKHHVRILAHCLNIHRVISKENSSISGEEKLLRKWCENQSKKFEDQKFSDLLFEQLISTTRKLKKFSQELGKNIDELDLDDLVLLVEQS